MTARQLIEAELREAVEGQIYIQCHDGWVTIVPTARGGGLVSSSMTRREHVGDRAALREVVQQLIDQYDGVAYRRVYRNGRWQSL